MLQYFTVCLAAALSLCGSAHASDILNCRGPLVGSTEEGQQTADFLMNEAHDEFVFYIDLDRRIAQISVGFYDGHTVLDEYRIFPRDHGSYYLRSATDTALLEIDGHTLLFRDSAMEFNDIQVVGTCS